MCPNDNHGVGGGAWWAPLNPPVALDPILLLVVDKDVIGLDGKEPIAGFRGDNTSSLSQGLWGPEFFIFLLHPNTLWGLFPLYGPLFQPASPEVGVGRNKKTPEKRRRKKPTNNAAARGN